MTTEPRTPHLVPLVVCDDLCRMRYHGALRSRRLMLLHELVHRMDRDVRQARTIIDELKPREKHE